MTSFRVIKNKSLKKVLISLIFCLTEKNKDSYEGISKLTRIALLSLDWTDEEDEATVESKVSGINKSDGSPGGTGAKRPDEEEEVEHRDSGTIHGRINLLNSRIKNKSLKKVLISLIFPVCCLVLQPLVESFTFKTHKTFCCLTEKNKESRDSGIKKSDGSPGGTGAKRPDEEEEVEPRDSGTIHGRINLLNSSIS
jgi:hypothetical protein